MKITSVYLLIIALLNLFGDRCHIQSAKLIIDRFGWDATDQDTPLEKSQAKRENQA